MESDFDLSSYVYELPDELIAQEPVAERDESRLLLLSPGGATPQDLQFTNLIDFLQPGDLLVVNNTRVFPARLLGRKETGGKAELFLLEFPELSTAAPHSNPQTAARQTAKATCLIKTSKRCRPGTVIRFGDTLEATVDHFDEDGKARTTLRYQGNLDEILAQNGTIPLPPYIKRDRENSVDRSRYQTVYADATGAVAAPTAGLHFSDALIAKIKKKKVKMAAITLHVGYGTFAPVRASDIRDHQIHSEYLSLSTETAERINETIKNGGTLWTVGTTTARGLEFAAGNDGVVKPFNGPCDLYIYPGYEFKIVKNLITNFHLPGSSLLFLVSALLGRKKILAAYSHAIQERYRFYSYGDAMAIVTSEA